jgi:glycerol-3-phosphate dehydrogenase (NAD(P)+)
LACQDADVLSQGQDLFKNTPMITDTCDDLVGVQWWSALKNIMAIGYGLLQQSTLGHNMSATFLTMAAKEINAIAQAKGGKASTALSFAGIGDLVLTSHCPASRNRSYGQLFPQTPCRLVEGLDTLQALRQHTLQCADWNVDTPVIQTIAKVLDGTLCIKKFPKMLMEHAAK